MRSIKNWVIVIGLALMISWGIMLLIAYISSYSNPYSEYTFATNRYGEQVIEIIMLVYGISVLTWITLIKVWEMGSEWSKRINIKRKSKWVNNVENKNIEIPVAHAVVLGVVHELICEQCGKYEKECTCE